MEARSLEVEQCELDFFDCPSERDVMYSVDCDEDACTCRRDGVIEGSFAAPVPCASTDPIAIVNDGCGWSLH